MPEAELHPPLKTHDVGVHREVRRHFFNVALPFKFAYTPAQFSRSLKQSTEALLIDIRKHKCRRSGSTAKREYFHMYLGKGNAIEILSSDFHMHQVLLSVEEPVRKITSTRRQYDAKLRRSVERVEETWTTGNKRFILMGVDDGHLFMCELSQPARTVAKAHRILRPVALVNKCKQSIKRQGEWFFSPLPERERDRIEAIGNTPEELLLRCFPHAALSGMAKTQRGRAHVAEKIVRVNDCEYAKGTITHPDHKTKTLNTWMQVRRNTEQTRSLMSGVSWMD